jgi:hypothetical protein
MTMQTNDKTGFGIGLGYMLGQLKFNTYVSKDSQAKAGYRLRRSVVWRNPPPPSLLPYIQKVLGIGDFLAHEFPIDGFTSIISQKRLRLLLNTINREYPIHSAFADKVGYHMWVWVWQNPMPSDYGSTLAAWAEAYDAEHKSIMFEGTMEESI